MLTKIVPINTASSMKRGSHPSWIEIDLIQFRKNIRAVRNYLGQSLYCLVIKANAYGHGMVKIGEVCEEEKIDYLAVAHLQEAITLREAGIRLPILVLGAIHEDQILDLIHYDLEFTISSQFKRDLVLKVCETKNLRAKVHLEVDTGMQRTGVRSTTAVDLFASLKNSPHIDVVGIYSHFATGFGNPFTEKQFTSFQTLLDHPIFHGTSLIRHIASSEAVLHYPHSHLDMVRPSLLTFGYPSSPPPEALKEIAPCFSLKSKVSYFKVVEEDAGISYGHSYVTKKQTRIVTVPIGYGDGFRRGLSNKGSVLIRGKKFPIVGTICMDQFMVDIGDSEVFVGDEVVLIGKQGEHTLSAQNMATLLDTIVYEVLVLFNDRIPRIYI